MNEGYVPKSPLKINSVTRKQSKMSMFLTELRDGKPELPPIIQPMKVENSSVFDIPISEKSWDSK